ncbi:DDE-type integrase/transposase/recombinase, partial [Streptococcus mutans]|nr:DDE-type integrase/transposase/recombinase [Streptococcus mutans]MCB5061922.1 DDE-type integrase/transposase/recombinase [Streptococcus mutans]MCB5074903.1 DDE-type integrase/transposase/recombinase [Streptococcus mutans]MCB5145244.1 DDE-type integrase/transposase/recombinase [Streptococcus mutans]MCB5149014.1 DDE-type integrase/transposase/recombinase [Streptococcus mutans]
MRILGHHSPIRKKRYHSCTQREITEKARHAHYNVLARNFKAERPPQKLTTDVSYVYYNYGRMFLSVIKDCYDNSILDYTLSDFNDNKLVFDNIDLVFNNFWDSTKVCILHSDQGFQYTNQQYLRKLDQYGVTISHSGKGNGYDNAACENFFSHLKSESLR